MIRISRNARQFWWNGTNPVHRVLLLLGNINVLLPLPLSLTHSWHSTLCDCFTCGHNNPAQTSFNKHTRLRPACLSALMMAVQKHRRLTIHKKIFWCSISVPFQRYLKADNLDLKKIAAVAAKEISHLCTYCCRELRLNLMTGSEFAQPTRELQWVEVVFGLQLHLRCHLTGLCHRL